MAAIVEEIAPGDRIPMHTHPIDELVFFRSGMAAVTVGNERQTVTAGAVAFIPAGIPHMTVNDGSTPTSLFAVFPSTRIGIHYLERNPAPGTEGDPPQPPAIYDARTGEVHPG